MSMGFIKCGEIYSYYNYKKNGHINLCFIEQLIVKIQSLDNEHTYCLKVEKDAFANEIISKKNSP